MQPIEKQPGYPPAQQPGYPPVQQPGYPPAQQPGYAPAPQPGYAPPPQYSQPAVIMQQPGQGGEQWMALQQAPPSNCPPGLEYLTQIDQLIVKQVVEVLEVITSFETNNKYKIKNSMGQNVFFAKEDTDCCTRQCCGPLRPFDLKIFDNANNEVIHLNRPLRCTCCWCCCCLQEIEVTSPPGTVIGYVFQKMSPCAPHFEICDADKNPVLLIEGPICQINCCCGDVEFKVLSLDGNTKVGKISKQFTGLVKEAFTDADNFGIAFPMDLDVKVKATMLAACFLIDFMFFENNSSNE